MSIALAERERQGRRIQEFGKDAVEEYIPEVGEITDPRKRLEREDEKNNEDASVGKKRRAGRVLKTMGEIMELVKNLVEHQIDRAYEMRSEAIPNEPITGDSMARTAFQTLLVNEQQRRLFLDVSKNSVSWPRLKPIFGAPPYHFLIAEDSGMLRATGISMGRVNMVYGNENPYTNVTNITQFGEGQLRDQHMRFYRVVHHPGTKQNDEDDLSFRLSSAVDPTNVVMHVKVPKRSKEEKLRLLSNPDTKKRCFFPQVGEKLTMNETGRVLALIGQPLPTSTECLVKRLVPREEHASTAVVVVTVI